MKGSGFAAVAGRMGFKEQCIIIGGPDQVVMLGKPRIICTTTGLFRFSDIGDDPADEAALVDAFFKRDPGRLLDVSGCVLSGHVDNAPHAALT